jgi:uncharacterized protein involved in exopolysaccharide biosynthesis
MALTPITPRDRLQRLVDLGRKTWRYGWLIAVFTIAGVGLSLVFALARPRSYLSWATLFYQERIQSSLVSANPQEIAQRNIGDRYRELLLARNQLVQIINDPTLDPFPPDLDPDLKIEKLRLAVRFAARGAMAFRIEYTDSDADRAKRVTEKLTSLLQEKDQAVRNEINADTLAFILEQKQAAEVELKKAETAFNVFLSRHPEFVSDGSGAPAEGVSIRKANPTRPTGPRQSGIERQLQRIIARLNAPPDGPPITTSAPKTPERIAAEAAVREAERDVATARRELDQALSKYTDKHPSAITAQDRLAAATQRLRQAAAALPPEVETTVRPATAEDRTRLEKERAQLEAELRAEQARAGRPSEPAAPDATEARVVQLESENTWLRSNLALQRESVSSLARKARDATLNNNQGLAEQGRLSVIDPAFKPARPSGPGKAIFLMAGTILFFALGATFALALAVIDDRLYRRADLDQLGFPVLAVIPASPPAKAVARRARPVRPKPPAQGKDGPG